MTWPAIFGSLSQQSSQRQTRAYWRTVPLRRLTYLLLAIFCMFGMVGCFVDLLSLGQRPLPIVLAWTIFSGAIAASAVLTAFRTPRRLWIVLIVWLLGSRLLSALIHHFASDLAHPTMEEGVRAATIACIILSLAAYIFFMRFIQNFGRHAVRIQTELSLAHGIQQTLVPVIDWHSGCTEIYGVSLPSAEVGGDLVDLVPLPDGSIFAYVADVSGHGLPAGILMGMIKTAVHTQLFDLPSPMAVFDRLNEVLPAVKEPHMYATCTALRIFEDESGRTCRVEYAIAGQPAMLLASSATATVSQLADQQLPLGLLAAAPYQGHSVDLLPGDLLLVATDGILEAARKDGVEFGLGQLESLLAENHTQLLATITQKIHDALSASYAQTDDQSLLLVRVIS
jgi:serine phosphatase RsbU (regulator of sigma subunit)